MVIASKAQLVGQDVGCVIDDESVVAFGTTLFGEHGFWDRTIARIDPSTFSADAIAWPLRWKRLVAFEADTFCSTVLVWLLVHVE